MTRSELASFARRWLALFALVVILVTFWVADSTSGFLGSAKNFVVGALPDAAVIVVAYLVTRQWLARRGLSETDDLETAIVRRVTPLVTKTPGILSLTYKVDENPWRELFDQANDTIVIVGRFFDVPVQSVGLGSLSQYFERGGRLRVFTLDPYDDATIGIAQHQWNYAARQKKLVPGHYSGRITTGVTMLENARLMARKPPGVLNIHVLPAINYAAYSFDNQQLIMVPYAHANSFDDPPPRLQLELDASEPLAAFWKNEVTSLSQESESLTAEQFLRIDVSSSLPVEEGK